MEDVEVPEANMLPNVKGFKVFPHFYYERQLPVFADPKHDLALVFFLHLPYVRTVFIKGTWQ
jgi:hypothetical protein